MKGPGPIPEAVVRGLDLTGPAAPRGARARRPAHARRSASAPSSRRSARTVPATTCARWTGTPPRARASRTCASTSPNGSVTTWLLLDLSPSMAFGTADRLKIDVAEGAATAVGPPGHAARQPARRHHVRRRAAAHPAAAPGAAPGCSEPSRPPARRSPPSRPTPSCAGPTSGPGSEAMRSDLAEALRRAGAVARSRSLFVIVTDFRGPATGCARCARWPPATAS
jgi:hypothetical protein